MSCILQDPYDTSEPDGVELDFYASVYGPSFGAAIQSENVGGFVFQGSRQIEPEDLERALAP